MTIEIQEILDEYRRSLILPKTKHNPPFILAPVGLIGTGKSAAISPLAEKLDCVRISGDEIRLLLKRRGLTYDSLHDIATTLHKQFHREGYSVAIDSDCASDQTREFIAECEKEFGVKTFWIHVIAPKEVVIARMQNSRSNHYLEQNPDTWIENYRNRKHLHEKLPMPFIYTFDSTKELDSQVEDAYALIAHSLSNETQQHIEFEQKMH